MNQKLLLALVIFAVCSLSSAKSKRCVQKVCPKNGKQVILLPIVKDCEMFVACYNGRALIRSCADKYRFDASIQACAPKKLVKCNECDDDSEEDYEDDSEEDYEDDSEEDSAESLDSDEIKDVIIKPEPEIEETKPEPEKEIEEIKPEPEKEVEEIKPEPEKEVEEIKPEPEKEVEETKPEPEKEVEETKPEPEKELSTEAAPSENISGSCKNSSVTPVSCPSVLPDDRLFSHPDDCHLFYYCVDSPTGYLPICRECPANLHFNPIKRVCDYSEVAGCTLTMSGKKG